MALRKACYVRMVIMLQHGAEVKLQASLFVPLPCYKMLHTRYMVPYILAIFQWIHKSLTLCVSQSFLERFGEHDQQSVLLSSCSQQNGLGRTCHELILVLLKWLLNKGVFILLLWRNIFCSAFPEVHPLFKVATSWGLYLIAKMQ